MQHILREKVMMVIISLCLHVCSWLINVAAALKSSLSFLEHYMYCCLTYSGYSVMLEKKGIKKKEKGEDIPVCDRADFIGTLFFYILLRRQSLCLGLVFIVKG